MKAAIFDPANQEKDGDRSVLEVHDINVRDPQPGEVLVRTTTSGVCHSDLHFVDGKWAAAFGGLPAVLGHEAAGVVETVGDDVTYVQPGDNVIMSFRPYCGDCYWCLRGEPNLCPDPAGAALARDRLNWDGRPVVQMASVGSFGEYMLTTQSGVLKIPEDIPPAEAALVGCGRNDRRRRGALHGQGAGRIDRGRDRLRRGRPERDPGLQDRRREPDHCGRHPRQQARFRRAVRPRPTGSTRRKWMRSRRSRS